MALRISFAWLACAALFSTTVVRADVPQAVALIPQPEAMERREGEFRFTDQTRIVTRPGDDAAAGAAAFLRERLSKGAGLRVQAAEAGDANVAGAVLITTQGSDASLGDEGYTLDVRPDAIVVRAPAAAGLFYGVQSLLQLLPPSVFGKAAAPAGTECAAPAVSIRDRPRFGWRGGMLDVARHTIKKEEIFRLLDSMAMHKANVFHWHLTDDQGWRIEIKRYPKLTEVGAWRDGIGFGLDPKSSDTYGPDGRYGGFFTQDDVREVVAYAAARHITVVPEIEMPGHASAALQAYPAHGCVGADHKLTESAGVFAGVYCAGTDETFKFLEGVLEEVIPLFPGAYLHVGGDEVPKEGWKACTRCQARIKAEGLKDEHELQSYFIRRMEKFLSARGKRLIGWDEILEGGLAPNATVMSWRGIQGGIAAARAGHDAVMSPTTHCYLDYRQATAGEPNAVGPLLPLEKTYAYEPIPAELTADQARHIRGVQGNLWTEVVANFARVGYQFYPRHTAIAEIGWSRPGPRDFADFRRRVLIDEARLDALGVTYRPLPPEGIERAIRVSPDGKHVVIESSAAGVDVRVTTDGSDPTPQSPRYAQPIDVPAAGVATVRARFFRPGKPSGYYAEQSFLNGRPATVAASLGQYQDNAIGRAFDGKPDTFFWGDRAMRKDDHVTIRFATPQQLRSVRVVTGKADGGDALADGVLEVSRENGPFAEVAAFRDGAAAATLDGQWVDAVRLRVRAPAKEWLAIREFTLE